MSINLFSLSINGWPHYECNNVCRKFIPYGIQLRKSVASPIWFTILGICDGGPVGIHSRRVRLHIKRVHATCVYMSRVRNEMNFFFVLIAVLLKKRDEI